MCSGLWAGVTLRKRRFCARTTPNPLIVTARSSDGLLVGYTSAFSDGAFTTMLGELIVRPGSQRLGIGRSLIRRVEDEFPGVPVYVKALGDARRFFGACDYQCSPVEMTVMFKRSPQQGTTSRSE
ncbi:MAG: N-acetyltransferase [Proteobacteria bacterium]|nr:MAG: N-acetyltransferase [Pseudomonadota bacterium]